MKQLSKDLYPEYKKHPIKVLQFGEGNFLRAFVDWQIDKMNREAGFDGGVAVVQPIPKGNVDTLREQDLLYTLFLQGMKNGRAVREHSIVNSLSAAVNPYEDYGAYLKLAECETLRFIVSNTTEAGIAFEPADRITDRPPSSYPAKLTAFLYRRFQVFRGAKDRGFIVIPCELIDRNGEKLKKTVLQYAELWKLGKDFTAWLEDSNTFCCSLVDRIVAGYPKDTIDSVTAELGYVDRAVDVGEQFHLWVIEGPKSVAEEIPFEKAGLNVRLVDDMTPYRTRKVRILNGSHTTLVPVAYLLGLDTVAESVNDPVVGKFLREALNEEIIPTLNLPKQELEEFAAAVMERFQNPFVKHYLMSIALNSFSKYETRVLPSLLTYRERKQALPKHLVFSLAALLELYKGKRGKETIPLSDEEQVMTLMQRLWASCDGSQPALKVMVREVLAFEPVWKRDLNQIPGLADAVAESLFEIESLGMKQAVQRIL